MTSPRDDQDTARLRDMQRLAELTAPYRAGPDALLADALGRMPAAAAAEARDILRRLGPIGEDPAITAAREDTLIRLAALETVLHEILSRPHYKIRGGKIVTNPVTGDPVPDEAFEQDAREELAAIERMRERLTGQPPAVPHTGHDSPST